MKKEAKDYGTAEIARQFTLVPKLSGPTNMTMKVVDGTEIDRLLLVDAINTNQHSTLESFTQRLHKMGFVGVRSPSYDSPIHADPSLVGDKRAASVRGMVKLFKRLDETLGAGPRRALVDLCLKDTKWPGDTDSLHLSIRALDDAIAGK